MPHILIVEDDPAQAELNAALLRHEGFTVEHCATAKRALTRVTETRPDIVLVDVGLPDLNGIELARRIRSMSAVPVILLTVQRQVSDKVLGLEAGADDYVIKPFHPAELIARVRAQLRRAAASLAPDGAYRIGPVCVDIARHRITLEGTLLQLSPREFDILAVLAQASGCVVRRQELFTRVWGADFFGDHGALDVYIRRLRGKIERDPAHPIHLCTIRGVGFFLAASG